MKRIPEIVLTSVKQNDRRFLDLLNVFLDYFTFEIVILVLFFRKENNTCNSL